MEAPREINQNEQRKEQNPILKEVEAFTKRISEIGNIPNTAVITLAIDTKSHTMAIHHQGMGDALLELLAQYLTDDAKDENLNNIKRMAMHIAVLEKVMNKRR